jgi:hypothetical protein
VEPLDAGIDFDGPAVQMLWLCGVCDRPFKLVPSARFSAVMTGSVS